jgi:hypothetical protein
MTVKDITQIEDVFSPKLRIPINGKTYDVEAVDAETGMRLQKLFITGVKAYQGQDLTEKDIELVSDDEEPDFFRMVLGDTYDELLKDKVSYQGLRFVSSVVFTWTTQNFETALEVWRNQGKAPAKNREQRRTETRTRTAAARTTQKQG